MKNNYLEQIGRNKGSFVLYIILRIAIAGILCVQIREHDWQNVFICVASLVLFLVPGFVENRFHIRLPAGIQNILLLFIFCAEILGEIEAFYVYFPWWDTMLHTIMGFLVAILGFSLVNLLNESNRVVFRLSPLFVSIVAFCFSMTISVFWEFGEFTMDQFFGLDMQKDTVLSEISSIMLDPEGGNTPVAIREITEVTVNGEDLGLGGYLDVGLYDTMGDLAVNMAGALAFSCIGYFCLKSEEKQKFLDNFVVKKEKKEGDRRKEES